MIENYVLMLRQQPYEERLDAVWVLGKGGYFWADPSTKFPKSPYLN